MDDTLKWESPWPTGARNRDYLPLLKETPSEFFDGHNEFRQITARWITTGVTVPLDPRPHANPEAALRHLRAAFNALRVPYDRQVAGCAYLLSLWFYPPGTVVLKGAGGVSDAAISDAVRSHPNIIFIKDELDGWPETAPMADLIRGQRDCF